MARTGAAMVMFEVIGSFQAKRLLSDAKAQMNIMNAILLNGLGGIFDAVQDIAGQINGLVNATVPLAMEVANAEIQFQKFMGTTENLSEVTNEIINMGASLGFTADKALEAGANMAQLKGLVGGETSVSAATEVGIKFALIGDMETQDAMKGLINLQQQTDFMFGKMTQSQIDAMDAQSRSTLVYNNSMKVLSQLNTVENNSAATMEQLIFIMNQFAAQADMTGESISSMAAQAAVLVESGEEMGKAGRALRMIYARLGANTQDNNGVLQRYGVQVKDTTTGALLPLSDILSQLAVVYKDLNQEQQQELAQLVAGNDHYVRFIKLVNGANREQVLATMASLGMSDAQEEVNIKLKNQATQLRLVQVELENTKSALGDALIPAQIAATRAQVSFNRAINSFYTMNGTIGEKAFGLFVKFGMDAAFHFERLNKVLGPVMNTMLQLKSLQVAMATQETILRSMQGEQLVNPAIYKDVYDKQRRITDDALAEYNIRLRINEAKQNAVYLTQMETIHSDGTVFNLKEEFAYQMLIGQEINAINMLEQERINLLTQQDGLQAQMANLKEKAKADVQQSISLLQAEANAQAALTQQQVQHLELKANLRQGEYQTGLNRLTLLQQEIVYLKHSEDLTKARFKIDNFNRDVLKEQLIVERQISAEKADQILDAQKYVFLQRDATQAKIHGLEIEVLKQTTKAGENEIKTLQQIIQFQKLLNEEKTMFMYIQDQLNALSAEEAALYARIIPNTQNLNLLTKEEIYILNELIPKMKQMNIIDEERAQVLFNEIRAEHAHNDAMKATGVTADTLQLQMMKYSAGLGAASMAVSFLDDSTQGAKVSMMLMTPVIDISTVQMFMMTKQMMQKVAVTHADIAATTIQTGVHNALTASLIRARAAFLGFAATTGGMLVLIGSAVALMYAFTTNNEDAADSVIRLNGALTDTMQTLNQLESIGIDKALANVPTSVSQALAEAGYDISSISEAGYSDLNDMIGLTQDRIAELTVLADDGSNIIEQAFQKELKAANDFLVALEAQQIALMTNAVLAGDLAAAQEQSALTAKSNAQLAVEQFYGSQDIQNAFSERGMLSGLADLTVGSDYQLAAKNSAFETAAAIIKGYESGLGYELSRSSIEDYFEVLGNLQFDKYSGKLFTTDAGGMGLSDTEAVKFLDFIKEAGIDTNQEVDMLRIALDDLNDAGDDSVDMIQKLMKGMDLSMSTEQAEILASYFDDMGSSSSGLGEVASELEGINDLMYKFNNNREAMFYGLSQSGVTGDFVKQVQQKGVENLVANTELIITNNFNGMSLPQMVNQVTEGVVERLIAAGVVSEGAVNTR